MTEDPNKIVVQVQDTPSGRLLAQAMRIMQDTGCTMGEAMDEARSSILMETASTKPMRPGQATS